MKNYFVVGGSSGIGKTLVHTLAQEHQVYTTFNTHALEDANNIHASHLDVASDDLDLSFLPEVIDGLVYCPGRINLKPFHRLKPESFLEDYNVQVLGAVKIIQAVLPRLKKSLHASIVMYSTVAVQQGFTFHAQVSASKGAIEGLTRALSAEFAPTIRVNAIAPSLTDTPLASKLLNTPDKKAAQGDRNPLKRVGEAQDIASATEFLLSSQSSWITGQVIHVDGGYSTIK